MTRECAFVLVCAVLVACSPTPPAGEDGGVTTDPSGSGASTITVDTLDTEDTLDTLDSSDTDEPPDPSTTTTTGQPVLDFGGPGDPPDPGAPCTVDSDCFGGVCYIIPFIGGSCGECNADAQCFDGGCTPPNPFGGLGSECNMGELGAGCESDAVCQGDLVCEEVFDLLGLVSIRTCSTCRTNADCEPGLLCAPSFELSEFNGVKLCVEPGSLPQDSSCELDGDGDQVCASGICSVVDVMGLAELGACGSCNTDLDCDSGSCIPGEFEVDTGAITGSTCI